MSAFNGSGTFIVSGIGLPYVTATVISSTVANQWNQDVATGLSNCITRDGQSPPTANLPMGGFKLTGLGAPAANGEALTFGSPASVSDITVTGVKNPNNVLIGPLTGPAAAPTWRALDPGDIPAAARSGGNIIINGDMRVDQRNGGASVTPTVGAYVIDRWIAIVQQPSKLAFVPAVNPGVMLPGIPAQTYENINTIAAYVPVGTEQFSYTQYIEGLNAQELLWGTANGSPVTLSFWVNATIAGLYCGSIRNPIGNRSYVFTYTVSAVSTWQKIAITIPPCPDGTWVVNQNAFALLGFTIGCGPTVQGPANSWQNTNIIGVAGAVYPVTTLGASFNITAVKLEPGSVATPFVPDNYQVQLVKCQRYYWTIVRAGGVGFPYIGMMTNTQAANFAITHPVPMRAIPTLAVSGAIAAVSGAGAGIGLSTLTLANADTLGAVLNGGAGAAWGAAGGAAMMTGNGAQGRIAFDAEL